MAQGTLRAGAARRIITPPVGVPLAGWEHGATDDNIARYVHDDLYVKALILQRGSRSWALLAADLTGVDAAATLRIRQGIARQTDLLPEAILVCATHCHSGPGVCPLASAYSPEERARFCARGDDGTVPASCGDVSTVSSSAYYVGATDLAWKEWFVTQAIEATVEAWHALRPAEVAFGQAEVEGVASSRRVFLSDGTWGDPRRDPTPEAHVVSRTEIDPLVRVLLLREQKTKVPLAAVINYGSHPWIFCGSGISAEIAGATADAVAEAWGGAGTDSPVVLYTTGPEGDVSLIWNIDIEQVWKTRPEESPKENLARRERGFDRELTRLSRRLAKGVMTAIADADRWDARPQVSARRQEIALPLKPGYRRPVEVLLADWQQAASVSHHLTEVQVLQVGDAAILGLPGEPFTSLGKAIRARSPFRHLLIAALANDFGPLSYIGDRAAYELGGYELTTTPIASSGGEVLVEEAAKLLDASETASC